MMQRAFAATLIFLSATLLAPLSASAQASDSLIDYTVNAVIDASGKTTITETILYDFGQARHHGIYRNIPLQSQDGNSLRQFGIDHVAVNGRDGIVMPFTMTKEGGYLRLKIGDPNTFVSGVVEYDITYTVGSLMRGYPKFDEWSWDVTSSNWPVPIRRARLSVKFPKSMQVADLVRNCATVAPNDPAGKETCQIGFVDKTASGTAESIQVMDIGLQPKESMRVSLGFPKGFIASVPMVATAVLQKDKGKFYQTLGATFLIILACVAIREYMPRMRSKKLEKGKNVV